MYLIQHTSAFNILRYAVRAYDLRTDRLVPGTIVDKREPDERMAGYPVARAATGDGVWAYTLYQKPSGRLFVHALDTSRGIARCIDLPRLAGVVQSMMGLSVDGGRLDVVSGGAVLAAVDRSTFRVTRSPAPAACAGRPRGLRGTGRRAAVRRRSWPSCSSGCSSPAAERRSPSDGGGQLAGDQAGLRRGHHLALEHRPEGRTRFRNAQCAEIRFAKIAVVAGDAARLGCHSQISPWRRR